MKARGIKIAVLYTTYLALPTNGWYTSWIDPFNKGPYGPSINSQIAKNMESCASPGFYFVAGDDSAVPESGDGGAPHALAPSENPAEIRARTSSPAGCALRHDSACVR
jgi:hypothetical protein